MKMTLPFLKRYFWTLHLMGGIVLLAFISACVHDPVPPKPVEPGDGETTACSPDSIYYYRDIQPIIRSSCARPFCHETTNQPIPDGGINYENYNEIIASNTVVPGDADRSDLYRVLNLGNNNLRMPPLPNREELPQYLRDRIRDWINQGARENDCVQEVCDTTSVSFAADVQPLIQTHCFGCHMGVNPDGGILLRNYNEIATSANSGALLGSIEHRMGFSPMPKNNPKWSDCDIAIVRNWIDNGTPNN